MADPQSSSSSGDEPMEIVEDDPIDKHHARDSVLRFPRVGEDVDHSKPSSSVIESTSDNRKRTSKSSKENIAEKKTIYQVDSSAIDAQTVKDVYVEGENPHIVARETIDLTTTEHEVRRDEDDISQQDAGENKQSEARVSSQLANASDDDDDIFEELIYWQKKDELAATKTSPLMDPSLMQIIKQELLNVPKAEDINKPQPRAPTDIIVSADAGPSWAQGSEESSRAIVTANSRAQRRRKILRAKTRKGTCAHANTETSRKEVREIVARPERPQASTESTWGQARLSTSTVETTTDFHTSVTSTWGQARASTSREDQITRSQTSVTSTLGQERASTSTGEETTCSQTSVASTLGQARASTSREEETTRSQTSVTSTWGKARASTSREEETTGFQTSVTSTLGQERASTSTGEETTRSQTSVASTLGQARASTSRKDETTRSQTSMASTWGQTWASTSREKETTGFQTSVASMWGQTQASTSIGKETTRSQTSAASTWGQTWASTSTGEDTTRSQTSVASTWGQKQASTSTGEDTTGSQISVASTWGQKQASTSTGEETTRSQTSVASTWGQTQASTLTGEETTRSKTSVASTWGQTQASTSTEEETTRSQTSVASTWGQTWASTTTGEETTGYQTSVASTWGQTQASTSTGEENTRSQTSVAPTWGQTQASTSTGEDTTRSQTSVASTWLYPQDWTSSTYAYSEMSWNQLGYGTSGFQTKVGPTLTQARDENSCTRESSKTLTEDSEDIMMSALSLSRQEKQPGRHQLGGDLSLASDLACPTPHSRRACASTRESRFLPYEPTTRNTQGSGTDALRKSRFVRSEKTSSAAQTDPPLPQVTFPGIFPAHQPVSSSSSSETIQYQTIRKIPPEQLYSPHTYMPYTAAGQIVPQQGTSYASVHQTLDHTYTPYNVARQAVPQLYTPQSSALRPALLLASQPSTSAGFSSTPMVYIPGIIPQLTPIIAPRNHQQTYTSRPAFDLPIQSETRPLDLSTSTYQRQIPNFLQMSQTSPSVSQLEPRTVRYTPRTHTYTSTSSTIVYVPQPLLLDLQNTDYNQIQASTRIEMYSSCSEHLLNQPHRPQTPTDPLPEHQLYQEWPVEDAASADQTEHMEVSDNDAWLTMQNLSSADVAVTQPPSVPGTRRLPTIVISPLTPTKATRPSSPEDHTCRIINSTIDAGHQYKTKYISQGINNETPRRLNQNGNTSTCASAPKKDYTKAGSAGLKSSFSLCSPCLFPHPVCVMRGTFVCVGNQDCQDQPDVTLVLGSHYQLVPDIYCSLQGWHDCFKTLV